MPRKIGLIEMPAQGDALNGWLCFADNSNMPFEIRRAYWIYSVPPNVSRGHHAHKELEQVLFPVSGHITITTDDGYGSHESFSLSDPAIGLYVPPGYWREMHFSVGAILLCLASLPYDESDYIRKYDDFLAYRKQQ